MILSECNCLLTFVRLCLIIRLCLVTNDVPCSYHSDRTASYEAITLFHTGVYTAGKLIVLIVQVTGQLPYSHGYFKRMNTMRQEVQLTQTDRAAPAAADFGADICRWIINI